MVIKIMNRYMNEYKSKLRTARQIVDMIEDDYFISAGQVAGSPQALYAELHNIKGRAKGVHLQTSMMKGDFPELDAPDMDDWLSNEAWFFAVRERRLYEDGRISYMPSHLSQNSARKLSCRKPNMFWGVSAPPDSHGNLNVAYGIAYEMDMIDNAGIVVLEVNENAPRTMGDNTIPLSRVDYIVESSIPRSSVAPATPSEIDIKIGQYIASLVEDRSTIQLGIGNIPNAVALSLKDKKDLGIHTEMITDSMMDLYYAGVITNRYKGVYRDRFVGTFVYGDDELYDFVNDNPLVQFVRGRVANNPYIIAQNPNMVSINTAVQVDLVGQVSSEAIGTRQYSGVGGQFDTAYGAQNATGGKSIIALRSTAKNGSISTIVPHFGAGTIVSLTRHDVDYIVTEYGIAHLSGRTVKERVKALIDIAHPDFREKLRDEADRLKIY